MGERNENSWDDAFENALVQSFDLSNLKMMVRHRLGLTLEHEVNVNQGTKYVVADLVTLATRQGWKSELLRAALGDNSRSPWLREVAASAEYSEPVHEPVAFPKSASKDSGSLEKLVRERGISLKWQEFTRRLTSLGRHLCRIELPRLSAVGTGFLVGPDAVLTNYHVVEDLVGRRASARDLICRFDYWVDSNGDGSAGLICTLAEDWKMDTSPYAPGDARPGERGPTEDELDYGLLRLSRRVGDEMFQTAGKRGWMRVKATPPVVLADDILVVPQHPDGRSLELAFGKALEYNSNSTRLHHDANTEYGSSGSPCLTVSLEPFGLHHASGPGRDLRYNQCVPLRQVIANMKKRGVSPFWEA